MYNIGLDSSRMEIKLVRNLAALLVEKDYNAFQNLFPKKDKRLN